MALNVVLFEALSSIKPGVHGLTHGGDDGMARSVCVDRWEVAERLAGTELVFVEHRRLQLRERT
jgi:hypothetical protein